MYLAGAACVAAAVVLLACRAAPSKKEEGIPKPAPSAGGPVLAQFDDHALTVEEFEAHLASLPPEVRAEYASPAARERLLNDLVQLDLLFSEARRRGVDRSPRVRVRVAELVVEEMMNALFGSETAAAAAITEDEIRRYYDGHSAEFTSPVLPGVRPAAVRSLDDVRTLIRARLAQEKRRAAMVSFTDELRARAHPAVHPERLPASVAAPSASAEAEP